MKSKYSKIILDAATLVSKIPGVSLSGVTKTASAYISAYRDYNEAINLLGIITANLQEVVRYEDTIKKYHKMKDYTTEELQGAVDFHFGKAVKAYKELKQFIKEREEQHWN